MVNIKDISAISGQSNSGQTARMQALQVAVAGELDLRQQKMQLLQQGISSGAPLVGAYLERKAIRDEGKRQTEKNKAYGNQVADYLGLPSISEIDKFQGLELQGGSDQAPTVNEQGQYQLGATNVPAIDPQKLALSRMIRDGTFSPKDINELDQMLAYGDEITPRGVKDKYTALNTKSEYQSLEGAPGTGTSRRNVSRDVDIDKGRADIANTYDTMAKRVAGGSGGGGAAGKQAEVVKSYLSLQTIANKKLASILEQSPDAFSRGQGYTEGLTRQNTKLGAEIRTYQGLLGDLAALKAKALTPGAGAVSDYDTKARLEAMPKLLEDTETIKGKAASNDAMASILAEQYGFNYQPIDLSGIATGVNSSSGGVTLADLAKRQAEAIKRAEELRKKAGN